MRAIKRTQALIRHQLRSEISHPAANSTVFRERFFFFFFTVSGIGLFIFSHRGPVNQRWLVCLLDNGHLNWFLISTVWSCAVTVLQERVHQYTCPIRGAAPTQDSCLRVQGVLTHFAQCINIYMMIYYISLSFFLPILECPIMLLLQHPSQHSSVS